MGGGTLLVIFCYGRFVSKSLLLWIAVRKLKNNGFF
jgi:hypothetical protein